MADSKISALPVGAAIAGTEDIPAVQSAANVRTTPAALLTYVLGQANTFLNAQSVKRDAIGTTSTDGLLLTNTTAAAVGAQQYSPRLHLTGQGWKTNATAASQTVDFIAEIQPLQSTVSPKPVLVVSSQANAGGYSPLIYIVQDTTNIPGATDVATFLHSSSGARGLFLKGGMGLSVGGSGTVTAPTTDAGIYITNTAVRLRSTYPIGWSSGTDPAGAFDTAIYRNAAGVAEITNGTANQYGSLKCGVYDANLSTAIDTLTISHQISAGTVATNCGIGMMFNVATNNAGTPINDVNAARIVVSWANADNATRKARMTLNVYDQTNTREVLRAETNGAAMIGFLGANAVVRQTSGANLTNNVTSGGTDNTIDNWTDLTTYATDAAAIRNAVYQLARKLKQVNDSLRTYGLLT